MSVPKLSKVLDDFSKFDRLGSGRIDEWDGTGEDGYFFFVCHLPNGYEREVTKTKDWIGPRRGTLEGNTVLYGG